jgi:acetyl-CoA carboxylase biotin carboxylase subunit
MPMLKRLLVANRGEIAVRIIRTCRMLGIESVAVYSDADSEALHVQMADRAMRLGPADPGRSYLNIERIVRAAKEVGADALHPGYGFVSENWNLAAECEEAGVKFVGPSSRTLVIAGNKVDCKKIAQRAGIPVVPGNENPLDNPADAAEVAEEMGYPVLLKSAFGGGGRGIRAVGSSEELEHSFRVASTETKRSLGRVGIFVEKLIQPARHVEVQILADGKGNVVHLGERECSIQRRHQKILEVTPCPRLSERARSKLCGYAVSLAKELEFENAGTVEFLMDSGGKFYFIETNSRLQVEHPITEAISGVDIVEEQLAIASGEGLRFRQSDVELRGAAIECRINAEDPTTGFSPSSGQVQRLLFPTGAGVRVDSALFSGCHVAEYYDSLLAKLTTYGSNFEEARRRMQVALDELVIQGVETTQRLQSAILERPEFKEWQLDVAYLDRELEGFEQELIRRRERLTEEGAAIAAAVMVTGIRAGPVPRRPGAGRTVFRQGGKGRFSDVI